MQSNYKLQYWESKSIDLLRKATIPKGIKASCLEITNYGSVFTRDAVMSGIAGLMYDDQVIIDGLRSTIQMLHQLKGDQGQIASNYKITNNEVEHVSFGTLSPKIDSATWYLVAIGLLINGGFDYTIEYVESTISLLNGIEYNGKDLMYIPQGGNWADEYPFEGYILYDQILRAWSLDLLGRHFEREQWSNKAIRIKGKIYTDYFNQEIGYYNCSFTPSKNNTTFDFAAHSLLGILIDDSQNDFYKKSLSWIEERMLYQQILPGAFYPVIDENHADWEMISNFHLFDFKNMPNHYHNGGVWYIWLGWFALALHKHGKDEALKLLGELSFDKLNAIDDFQFSEYLSADTYQPYGTQQLCYTATGILFLCKSLSELGNPIELIK